MEGPLSVRIIIYMLEIITKETTLKANMVEPA